MARFSYNHCLFITFLIFILLLFIEGVSPTTITVINNCNYTIWPGILADGGNSESLEPNTTGFELAKGSSRSFQAPATGWGGRFWGRTNCNFDYSVNGSCATGDCGTGKVECNGAGSTSPATLVEFTLDGYRSQDFYDVSLVDGYNLPVIVEESGGSGECGIAGCAADLNKNCPSELRIDGGAACNSACSAFKQPQYCCSGDYSLPDTCKPTNYSEYFKSACANSYAYAYDDRTLYRFICTKADYNITFCPNVGSNCRFSKFKCGNITAEYPFFGGLRGEECGLRGLQLHCEYVTPKIDIRNVRYQVLDIDRDSQVLSIARDDLINNGFCSPQFQTSPLDSQLFHALGADYTNLTLFYDCPEPSLISSRSVVFLCNVTEKTGPSYTNVSVVKKGAQPLGCVANVTVPILQDSLKRLLKSSLGLEEALEAGFKVEWKEDRETCRQCENSGGMCGFDKGNQTICYCPFPFDNWQEAKKCPYNSPSSTAPSLSRPRTHGQGSTFKIKMKWKVTIGVVGSTVVMSAVFLHLTFIWKKKLRERQNLKAFVEKYGPLASKRYSYSKLKKMTKAFKHQLGEGGYGSVYKGKLPNDDLIAVKVLKESKGNGEEFINEVASISRTSHVNIVALLGFCYEGSKRALIYEYMPNGSLDKFIYEKKRLNTESNLELKKLYQITLGIARGLEYLHQGCNTRILHFDIKPHNILLDEEFRPKISDFGLAKLCQRKESIVSMLGARGTRGYMAPEIWDRSFGGVSYKSDVYSFGMLVLEMVGGRKNLDLDLAASHASEIYFPQWIYKQVEIGQDLKLNGVVTEDDETIARKMIVVSLWCIQMSPLDRPSMKKVIEMLEGSLESLQAPPQPFLSSPFREQQSNFSPSSEGKGRPN